MKAKNYIDPYKLSDDCEGMIIETIQQILRDQIPIFTNYKRHDSDEDEIVNHAFGYLVTNLYKQETNNYDGKN
jgi:hypothetical protein